jgi:FkbH-like protein
LIRLLVIPIVVVCVVLVFLWATIGPPILSACALGGLLWVTGLLGAMGPFHWLVAAPLLYMFWLLGFLALSALEMRLLFAGFEKPRSATFGLNSGNHSRQVLVGYLYLRGGIVTSLPLYMTFMALPSLRWLALRAYSPRVRIGANAHMFATLYDPDITEIGDNVVIGSLTILSAHGMTASRTGEQVYVSAPIRIEDGVTIGGEGRIGMGVVIGVDAIVEAGSVVSAFTTIPPAEIWAGNPAVFQRKRHMKQVEPGQAVAPVVAANPLVADDQAASAARRVVAHALNISEGELDSAAEWDSLDQFAIAASLHDAHGCRLRPDEILKIHSLADIERWIQGVGGSVSEVTKDIGELPDHPELLPLLDHEMATRLLAARPTVSSEGLGERLRVVVAASFTAEPLAPALRLWSRGFGIEVETDFQGFNQVEQALLSPSSPFRSNDGGMNVVLLRVEDLSADPAEAEAAIDRLLKAVESFQSERKDGSALVVGTLPPASSARLGQKRAAFDLLRANWSRRLAEMADLEVFDFSAVIEDLGLSVAIDAALEAAARAPYSPRGYQEIGIGLARLVRKRRRPTIKVIALDCDNTLWGGVLGEDGIDGIQVGSDGPGRSFQLFQQALLERKKQGVLLTLLSRNEEQDVLRVFDEHPGMVLRRSDISAWRINWNPKPEGLSALAEELNLGRDAFLFIDDDPAQQLHMKREHPGVVVLPLPNDPARFAESLDKLWLFDAAQATAEDANRTEMMLQERARQHDASAADLPSFLHGLGLEVEIRPAEDRDLPRVAQLTQKTNQFNLSLRRRTLEEIRALGPGHEILILSARDRFGDYGLVGTAILYPEITSEPALVIDTFLLSCRALGRGVEEAFLHAICASARAKEARIVRAPFVTGPRNQPALRFFTENGFTTRDESVFERDANPGPALPEHVALDFKDQTYAR